MWCIWVSWKCKLVLGEIVHYRWFPSPCDQNEKYACSRTAKTCFLVPRAILSAKCLYWFKYQIHHCIIGWEWVMWVFTNTVGISEVNCCVCGVLDGSIPVSFHSIHALIRSMIICSSTGKQNLQICMLGVLASESDVTVLVHFVITLTCGWLLYSWWLIVNVWYRLLRVVCYSWRRSVGVHHIPHVTNLLSWVLSKLEHGTVCTPQELSRQG